MRSIILKKKHSESVRELNQRNDKSDFTKGSIAQNMLRMAIPMTIAQIINVLYNLVDRMYIGRLDEVGRLALTGIGICAPVLTIIMAFANLCGLGGAPLFSMARGRKDDREAGKIMGNSFCLLLILGVVLTVVGLVIRKPLLYWLGADDTTFEYANSYLSIYLIGTLMVMISLGMNPFINAQGASKIGMMTVAIGAVANIALDPLFIFAFNMGVAGAALATILSQTISAAWVLAYLCRKKTPVRIAIYDMKLEGKTVGKIAALGVSGFCLAFTTSLVQMMCNKNLRDLGGTMYVSVMTIINSVRDIFFAGVNGLTNGANPIIGYNYGAGKYSRVCGTIRFCTFTALGYCAVAWAAILAFPTAFIRIFNADPELLTLGKHCFRIYFAAFGFMAFQLCGQVVSQGLGKAKTAIFFSLLRKVIIMVPLILLLPRMFGLGVDGIFLAEPISNVIGGLACYITMFVTVYRPLSKKEDLPEIVKTC